MPACGRCGKQIMWAKTTTGKSMPLSLPAVEYGGNVWIEDGVAHVTSKEAQPPLGVPRYKAHFADCKP